MTPDLALAIFYSARYYAKTQVINEEIELDRIGMAAVLERMRLQPTPPTDPSGFG